MRRYRNLGIALGEGVRDQMSAQSTACAESVSGLEQILVHAGQGPARCQPTELRTLSRIG